MQREEWDQIVAIMATNWPHQPPTDGAIEKWYADLADRDGRQVLSAVEAIYRDGAEFPPNGGQILAKLSELERDDPDHGQAWALAMKAVQRFGFYRAEAGLAWLDEQSPAVGTAVLRFGYDALCHADIEDIATVRAQFREVYKAVCAERGRDDAYSGLPSAGLRSLERGPKRIGAVLERARGEAA